MLVKEKIDPELAYSVSVLFTNELGHGDMQDITKAMNSEDELLVVIQDMMLIGAATAHIMEYEEIIQYYPKNAPQGTYGMLDDSVVRKFSRGQGYGKRLVKLRLDWLRSRKAIGCFALAWDHPGKERSAPVLETMGFVEIERRENVWVTESCPYCGESCRCDALLMFKNLRIGA